LVWAAAQSASHRKVCSFTALLTLTNTAADAAANDDDDDFFAAAGSYVNYDSSSSG